MAAQSRASPTRTAREGAAAVEYYYKYYCYTWGVQVLQCLPCAETTPRLSYIYIYIYILLAGGFPRVLFPPLWCFPPECLGAVPPPVF